MTTAGDVAAKLDRHAIVEVPVRTHFDPTEEHLKILAARKPDVR
jgi:hypothetical protein